MQQDQGSVAEDPGSQEALRAGLRREVLNIKLAAVSRVGWSPLLRMEYEYFTPDECYEAFVHGIVTGQTEWLDVGCGRDVFPSNPALADLLGARCRRLTGLDPSDNIHDNRWVHEAVQATVEDYRPDRRFDLVTMRMVAEHISDPQVACGALARLVAPGGRLIIFTVARWTPSAVAASLTPMAVHHAVKKILWGAEERDTFPTVYRMNTRDALAQLLGPAGFTEETFERIDDCRAFARWPMMSRMELRMRRLLRGIGLGYPEACIIGIYRRTND